MSTKKNKNNLYRGGSIDDARNINIETLNQVRIAEEELKILIGQRNYANSVHAALIPVYTRTIRNIRALAADQEARSRAT